MPDIEKDALGTILDRAGILKSHRDSDGFPLDPDRPFYRRLIENQALHTASILCPQYFESGKKEPLEKVAELLEQIWFKDDSQARFVKEFTQLIDSLKQGKLPEEAK